MRAIYKWSSILALWVLAMVPASAETLHAGMSGDAVTALQNSLVAAGYLARTVDGDYGSTTKEAVYLFQKDKGLTANGIADDATRAAIRRAEGAGYRNGGGVVYAEGNRGDVIFDMQQRLQEAGSLKGDIDGVYGGDTVKAVKDFQRSRGFPVSGAIDEVTYRALRDISAGRRSSDIWPRSADSARRRPSPTPRWTSPGSRSSCSGRYSGRFPRRRRRSTADFFQGEHSK